MKLSDLLLVLQRHVSILCLHITSCCGCSILPPSPGSMTPRALRELRHNPVRSGALPSINDVKRACVLRWVQGVGGIAEATKLKDTSRGVPIAMHRVHRKLPNMLAQHAWSNEMLSISQRVPSWKQKITYKYRPRNAAEQKKRWSGTIAGSTTIRRMLFASDCRIVTRTEFV